MADAQKFINVREGLDRMTIAETPPETRRRAARALACAARDAQDAQLLLEALGLAAAEGKAPLVLAAAQSPSA